MPDVIRKIIPCVVRRITGDAEMEYVAVNLQKKLAGFSDYWSPKIVAQMNDYHFKLVKFQGDFVWHRHDDTDEVFINLAGEMTIEFRNGKVEVLGSPRRDHWQDSSDCQSGSGS